MDDASRERFVAIRRDLNRALGDGEQEVAFHGIGSDERNGRDADDGRSRKGLDPSPA
jgi:hypothetical protein